MKSFFTLVCLLFLSLIAYSQCDYVTETYSVSKDSNVVYGIAINFAGQTDTLKMDIYKPIGDNNVKRPIILFIHGGGFHGGNRASFSALCEAYASRGYVAATMSYRLGFYRPFIPDAYPYVYDTHEINRAVYRSMQDGFGAVRFLKGRAISDSTDKKNFFIGGASAGAITALHMAFGHSDTLKKPSHGNISKVVLGLSQYNRPDLGDFYGSLNLNGENTKVNGVINLFGAISDTTWIRDSKDPALFSYHQTGDPVVPCNRNRPYHGIGLGMPDRYIILYGSCHLSEQLDRLGYSSDRNEFYGEVGNAHEVSNIPLIDSLSAEFLENLICTYTGSIENKVSVASKISLFPNPSSNKLSFTSEHQIQEIYVLNHAGQIVQFVNAEGKKHGIINTSELKNGTYHLKLINEHGYFYNKSFVKIH